MRKALAKQQRWDDEAYLGRIIFEGIVPFDEHGEETGYGISTYLGDNAYPILVIDPAAQKVLFLDEADFPDGKHPLMEYTFEGYIAQERVRWPQDAGDGDK